MNRFTLLLAAAAIATNSAAADDGFSAWQWEHPVEVQAAGWIKLDLPPAVLDHAAPSLADVRVLAPTGVETPYLLDLTPAAPPTYATARNFVVRLAQADGSNGPLTRIEFDTGTDQPVTDIRLQSPAREFLKPVTVEATADGVKWVTLTENELVFRQADGAERLTLGVGSAAWRSFRLSIADARSAPVPFSGVGLKLAAERPPPSTVPHAIAVRFENGSYSLDCGAANLHLDRIKLVVADGVFSRRYKLSLPGGEVLASGMIYRVAAEGAATAEQVDLPLGRRISGRRLVLAMEDADSPPLNITAAAAERVPTVVEFHASAPGRWLLLSGNPRAAPPRYDLAPLREMLAKAAGQQLTAGPPRVRAGYQPPVPLAGIDPTGADMDTGGWTRRCKVEFPGPGVVAIELQPAQLAAARGDLGDLRLIQNGRQTPYLLDSRTVVREVACELASAPPEPRPRPTVSRWLVRRSLGGYPAGELLLATSTPVFRRVLKASDLPAEKSRTTSPSLTAFAAWSRSKPENREPFHLPLGGDRWPAEFILETDNGDNPPLSLTAAHLTYQAPVLVAKLVSPEPLYLYYGNPDAAPPAYDLGLVRSELLAAEKVAATLQNEEPVAPGRKRTPGGSGSVWLWIGLGLVVALLLFIVAKLLPMPASAG